MSFNLTIYSSRPERRIVDRDANIFQFTVGKKAVGRAAAPQLEGFLSKLPRGHHAH